MKKISESINKSKEDEKDFDSLSKEEKIDSSIDIIERKKEFFINEDGTLSGTVSKKHKV
jgi:hypothetical protein